MRSAPRLLIALACTLAAVAAASATAGASTMFLEPAGAIEAPSAGAVTFEFEGTNVSCAMLLRGRLNSSYSMVEGAEVGKITSATTSECSNGGLIWLTPTEWEMVYAFILGEVLNFRGVLWGIRRIRFLVESGLLFRCLYEIRGGALIGLREEPGSLLISWTWLRPEVINSTQLGFSPCPRTMNMSGRLTLRPAQREHIV